MGLLDCGFSIAQMWLLIDPGKWAGLCDEMCPARSARLAFFLDSVMAALPAQKIRTRGPELSAPQQIHPEPRRGIAWGLT